MIRSTTSTDSIQASCCSVHCAHARANRGYHSGRIFSRGSLVRSSVSSNGDVSPAFAVFARGFFGVGFLYAVPGQVAEFVSHPVAQPIISPVTIGIDVNASTGQMGEHLAGHPSRHLQVVHLGRVDVLPVWHEDDTGGKGSRLHNLNLSAKELLPFRRGALYRIGKAWGGRWLIDTQEPGGRDLLAPPSRRQAQP